MSIWLPITLALSLMTLTPLSQANNLLPELNSEPIQTPQAAELDVIELKAEWWKVLTLNNTLFEEARLRIEQQLALDIRNQKPELRADLEEKLENIQRGLATLKRMRDQPSATLPEITKIDEKRYSWSEWQQRLRTNHALQVSVHELEKEVNQQVQGQALLTQQVDNLTASYLAESINQRFPIGMELIEKRLAWLISQQSLRLEKAQLATMQARSILAEQEFKLAQAQLTINDHELEQLKQEQPALEKAIDRATNSLSEQQALIPTIVGDDALTRTKRNEARLQALELELNLSTLETKLSWSRLGVLYLQRFQQPKTNWSTEQRALLVTQDEQISRLTQQHGEFRPLIERYREQAQTALLTLDNAQSERTNAQSKRLNQQLLTLVNRLMTQQQTLQQQLADNRTLINLLQEQLRHSDGQFKSALKNLNTTLEDAWNTSIEWLNISLFKMGETPVTTAGILRVFIVISIAWWFSYWLRHGVTRITLNNQKIADSTVYTVNRVLHYLIMLIGIMIALSSVGLDFSSLAWIAGALSVGIGFGLQSIVNNFVSGLIIMFERSLKVGDFIELQSGVSGTVTQINMRSTIIRTFDHLEIVVPNSEFISGRVVNWTLSDNDRRLRIPFSVEYGTDKEEVVRLVMQAARAVPYTLEDATHEPQVWLTNMGDNGLEFELLVWIRHGEDIEVRRAESRQGLRAAYLWEIESAFRNSDVGMPFPQRDYYIRSILGQDTVEGFVKALNTLKQPTTEQTRPL